MTMRRMRRTVAAIPAAALAAGILAAGARAEGPGIERAPRYLSQTGLYAGSGTALVDARNLPFAPQYPLWTDGAAKSRWIYLPEGSSIDATDPDAWSFPVGTKLWKQFSFAGRKVETRMIWKTGPSAWVFASYVWNGEQTDAQLAPDEGVRGAAPIAPGRWHDVPSRSDCATCHEGGRGPVLGFNALQLSDDRDPEALHADPLRPGMVTLRSLIEGGRLAPEHREWLVEPPRIVAKTPRERAVLGYFAGNCAHCHNASGPQAPLGLVLAHAPGATEPAISTSVDVAGSWRVPGVPEEESRRVAPGDPARSAIVYRMSSRRPSSQMPPLGTVLVDDEALATVRAWIIEDLPRDGGVRDATEGP